jgi:hypothetical protein
MSLLELEMLKLGQNKIKDKIVRQSNNNYIVFMKDLAPFKMTDVSKIDFDRDSNQKERVLFYTKDSKGQEIVQGVFWKDSIVGYAMEVVGKVIVYEGTEKQVALTQAIFNPNLKNEVIDTCLHMLTNPLYHEQSQQSN